MSAHMLAATSLQPGLTRIIPDAVAELVTASDVTSASASFGETVAELASAADTTSEHLTIGKAVAESVSAVDVVTGGLVIPESVIEAALAADLIAYSVIVPLALFESVSPSDVYTTEEQDRDLILEHASAVDFVSLVGGVSNVLVVETASAVDTFTVKVVRQPTIWTEISLAWWTANHAGPGGAQVPEPTSIDIPNLTAWGDTHEDP